MSDLVTPDFSDVQDPVEAGTYVMRVTEGEIGKWENDRGTTHFVKWTLETMDEEDSKNNGRKVWDRTPISGGGAFRFQNFYRAATGEAYPKGQPLNPSDLVGAAMRVTVEQTPEGYINVKSYAKADA